MKFLSVLILVVFSFSSFAGNGVKSIVDDLTYSLNVEWDQKDQRFYNDQMELFSKNISLLKDQGLSNEEILNSILASMKNDEVARDAKEMFRIISAENLTDTDAMNIITSLRHKSYHQGASWNGNVVMTAAIVAAIIVGTSVILYGISGRKLRKLQEECEGGGSSNQTDTTNCERTPG